MLSLTYIGPPTALLELTGLRFLTDPGFDPAGTEYRAGSYVLTRTTGPALASDRLLPIDCVLLSHDHHFDNLDESGCKFLAQAGRTITTVEGAARLGRNAVGLKPWESIETGKVKVTATPARHGPAGGDRGPVIGFILEAQGVEGAVYVSGDTVLYEGVLEVAARFDIRYALLFMGAARVAAVGPQHLTFTADEAVILVRHMPHAWIVPLHVEGWAHFTEGRSVIEETFQRAGLSDRLIWLEPGEAWQDEQAAPCRSCE